MKNQLFKNLALGAIVMLMSILGTFKANAQAVSSDKIAQSLTDSLTYLKLTDQQKTQAEGFNKTAAASLAQLAQKAQKDTSLKGKALAQQVMGIMKQRNASLKKILTPDQTKLYQQHQVQQMAELETKMMTAQLDLTETQVPQVYSINLKSTQTLMTDMAAVKSATRKLKKAREAKKMKSDAGEKDKELKKILSSDQYTKYEKNKEQMQAAMKEKMKEKKAAKG
jgi:hypothetical protein